MATMIDPTGINMPEIDVKCEECQTTLDVVGKWAYTGGYWVSVKPCQHCISKTLDRIFPDWNTPEEDEDWSEL